MFKQRKAFGPFGVAVTANVFLGTTVVAYKFGFAALHPLVFASLSYGLAGLVIGSFAWKLAHLRDLALVRKLAVNCLLMLAFVVLWVLGLDNSTAIKAALLSLSTPIIIYLLAALLLRERVIKRALVGCLVGLFGSLMIIGLPAVWQQAFVVGDVMLLGSYFCISLLVIHTKYLYKWLHPAEIIGYRFFLTGVVLLVYVLLRFGSELFMGATASSWLALAYVVAVASLGVPLLYKMLKQMEAEAMAPTLYADPLAGTLAAALLLGEVLEPGAIAGVAVVVIGLLISHPYHHRLYYRLHVRNRHVWSGVSHWLHKSLPRFN